MAKALIADVFESVKFQVHTPQNGELTFADFNRRSKIMEVKMLGWLTGAVTEDKKPEFVTPYDSQKSKDWLSPAIKKYRQNLEDGVLVKPEDYYSFENLHFLLLQDANCENEEDDQKIKRVPIRLLDGDKFNERANTYIKSLQPSLKVPIAKEVGDSFEFLPLELGSVELEYVAYPEKYGNIVTKIDSVFKEEVIDEAATQNYIWGEWAVEVLSWFIVQDFGIRVRDNALFQMNQVKGKQP